MDLNPINLEIQDIDFIREEEEREEEYNIQIRVPKRYIRDAENPFDLYNEWEFKRRFRFTKDSVMFGILPLIEEGLAKVNNRGLPIPPIIQLLVCLRFYSSASFQVSNKSILFCNYTCIK